MYLRFIGLRNDGVRSEEDLLLQSLYIRHKKPPRSKLRDCRCVLDEQLYVVWNQVFMLWCEYELGCSEPSDCRRRRGSALPYLMHQRGMIQVLTHGIPPSIARQSCEHKLRHGYDVEQDTCFGVIIRREGASRIHVYVAKCPT